MNDTCAQLESYREPLRLLGNQQVHGSLAVKVDVCGVVQETLWEAHLQRSTWQHFNDRRRSAWLRRVFLNNLFDRVRHFRRQLRDYTRECSLDDDFQGRGTKPSARLSCHLPRPADRAILAETILQLRHALASLPPSQQEAIELHYLQALPLAVVGKRMGRSKGSVAGLIFRGINHLRAQFGPHW